MGTLARRAAHAGLAAALLVLAACSGEADDGVTPTAGDPASLVEPHEWSTADPEDTFVPGSRLPDPEVEPTDVVDLLEGEDAPGPVDCAGCPTVSGVTSFEPDLGAVTSTRFSGTVQGADGAGELYVRSAGGAALRAPIAVAADGSFDVTAPIFCGEQVVKMSWANDAGRSGVVLRPTAGACPDPDLRVTLSWSEEAESDGLELHLVRLGGTINDSTGDGSVSNDCSIGTCVDASPDWGALGEPSDDPVMDLRRASALGPDSITLARPAESRYVVLVEHRGESSFTATDVNAIGGEVIINVAGGSPVVVPMEPLAARWVFQAAAIDFPGGTVTPVGVRFDCREAWGRNGGCGAGIP